jgi:hypothetical protein
MNNNNMNNNNININLKNYKNNNNNKNNNNKNKTATFESKYWKSSFVPKVRMRESYKRFVKTWIHFGNIHFDLWTTNLDVKRFVLVCGPQIQISKGSYRIVDHESSQFSKGSTNPINPMNPHESLVLYTKLILTNNPRIQICKSDSMDLFQVMTDKSSVVYLQIRIPESGHFKKV